MSTGSPFLLAAGAVGTALLVELDRGRDRVTIGRGATCDVALPWDRQVSRLHADVVRMGADWVVQDEGLSRNGTFVNGERVRGRRRLRIGDAIVVGATVIEVCGPDPACASAATDVAAAETVAITVAQRRVLEAFCGPLIEGEHAAASNREIAAALVISVETVKSTVSALLERFGLTDLPPHQKRAALAARGVAILRDA